MTWQPAMPSSSVASTRSRSTPTRAQERNAPTSGADIERDRSSSPGAVTEIASALARELEPPQPTLAGQITIRDRDETLKEKPAERAPVAAQVATGARRRGKARRRKEPRKARRRKRPAAAPPRARPPRGPQAWTSPYRRRLAPVALSVRRTRRSRAWAAISPPRAAWSDHRRAAAVDSRTTSSGGTTE